MISMNLSCIIRCYVNIVIDSKYIYINSEKISWKTITVKTLFKLIVNCFIGLIITAFFIFIDNKYKYLSLVIFIELIINFIKHYINLEFPYVFNNCITRYWEYLVNIAKQNYTTFQFKTYEVRAPAQYDVQYQKQDQSISFMQQVFGAIHVSGDPRATKIYSFNNRLSFPRNLDYIPSYNILNDQARDFFINNFLAIEVKYQTHQYLIPALDREIRGLNTFNMYRTIQDIPMLTRIKICRLEQLCNRLHSVDYLDTFVEKTDRKIYQLKNHLSFLKQGNIDSSTILSNHLEKFKNDFYNNRENSIAAQVIELRRASLVARAKATLDNTNSLD